MCAQDSSSEHQGRWSREWFESRGITFETKYRGEVFGNLHGGMDRRRGGEYLGSADSTIALDLKKLRFGRGTIVVTAQSLHGRGINDPKVGALQAVSNLDAASFNKLIETYFTDRVFHNRLTFKAGRLYADADFNAIEGAGDFLNSSYGRIPTVPVPTYPAPQVGATVWSFLNPHVSLGAGIYRGVPLACQNESSPRVSTGAFTILETKVDLFSSEAVAHGTYRIGIWQQGQSAWNSHAPLTPARNYGAYATGEHWLRKPLSSGENWGPNVFFQIGWSPSDRNETSSYWGIGSAYPGIAPRRSRDTAGVGVTQARLGTGNETVLELFYKFQVMKRMFLQPDMQWVSRPGGSGRNVLLGGLRFGISF